LLAGGFIPWRRRGGLLLPKRITALPLPLLANGAVLTIFTSEYSVHEGTGW